MKHGYHATAGPLQSSKRYRLVGTMITNGMALKVLAIDTGKVEEEYPHKNIHSF
jgi:hypothetical protein